MKPAIKRHTKKIRRAYHELKLAIRNEILQGKHDQYPEGAFMYCGAVEDVAENAKKMADM